MKPPEPVPLCELPPSWTEPLLHDSDVQVYVRTFEDDGELISRYSPDIATSDITAVHAHEDYERWAGEFAVPFARLSHMIFREHRGAPEGVVLEHRVLARHGLGNLGINYQAHRLQNLLYAQGQFDQPESIEEGFIHEDWNLLQEGETDWELFQIVQGVGTRALLGAVEPLMPEIYSGEYVKNNFDEVMAWLEQHNKLPFPKTDNPLELFQGIRLLRDLEYRRQLAERDDITSTQLANDTIYAMRGVFHWMPEIPAEMVADRFFANNIVTQLGNWHETPEIIGRLFDLEASTRPYVDITRFDADSEPRRTGLLLPGEEGL